HVTGVQTSALPISSGSRGFPIRAGSQRGGGTTEALGPQRIPPPPLAEAVRTRGRLCRTAGDRAGTRRTGQAESGPGYLGDSNPAATRHPRADRTPDLAQPGG